MRNRFVYFDLGKVLVHFEHSLAVEQLASLASRPNSLVQQVVFDSELQNRYETGLVTSQQFASEINRALDAALPEQSILAATSAIFEPNPAIMEAIELLKQNGVSMGILSNTCPAHWEWILAQQWPMFGDWFSTIVLSYEVQAMKPAERIYEVCEQRAGCSGTQIFFTDDRADNIAAAARRGWSTYQFTDPHQLRSRLEEWL